MTCTLSNIVGVRLAAMPAMSHYNRRLQIFGISALAYRSGIRQLSLLDALHSPHLAVCLHLHSTYACLRIHPRCRTRTAYPPLPCSRSLPRTRTAAVVHWTSYFRSCTTSMVTLTTGRVTSSRIVRRRAVLCLQSCGVVSWGHRSGRRRLPMRRALAAWLCCTSGIWVRGLEEWLGCE